MIEMLNRATNDRKNRGFLLIGNSNLLKIFMTYYFYAPIRQ